MTYEISKSRPAFLCEPYVYVSMEIDQGFRAQTSFVQVTPASLQEYQNQIRLP